MLTKTKFLFNVSLTFPIFTCFIAFMLLLHPNEINLAKTDAQQSLTNLVLHRNLRVKLQPASKTTV